MQIKIFAKFGLLLCIFFIIFLTFACTHEIAPPDVETVTPPDVETVTPPDIETVASPSFSLPSGPQIMTELLEISCSTSGASIRYTTDGSVPSAVSTLYTQPIPITASVKAIAMKDGWNNSGITQADFILTYTPESDFFYTIDSGAVTLTKYKGSASCVAIPPSIEGIPVRTLYQTFSILTGYNTVLKRVSVPDTVTTIGYSAFGDCSALVSVEIGSSVVTIGDFAFFGCITLESIILPNSVETIGNQAYYGCSNLINVNVGNGLLSIGTQGFFSCDSLESIVLPPGFLTLGRLAFEGCSMLKSADLGISLTIISEKAFENCSSLEEFVVPVTVTEIGDGAYKNCDSLQSVYLPNTITSLGSSAFEGCDNLESVRIGPSISSFGFGTFGWCPKLVSVVVESTTPPVLATYVFFNDLLATYYVPSSSLSAYQTADGWKDFADDIYAIP